MNVATSDHYNRRYENMRLNQIKANQTELYINRGPTRKDVIVFFSYNTPVAAQLNNGDYVRTSTKWSQTTTRHINQWLDGVDAKEVEQEVLNELIDLITDGLEV